MKKSSGSKKIAMQNVAENMGFPKQIVKLRHQAIHETVVGMDQIEEAV
jgi:hypothetical protein